MKVHALHMHGEETNMRNFVGFYDLNDRFKGWALKVSHTFHTIWETGVCGTVAIEQSSVFQVITLVKFANPSMAHHFI